MYDISPCAQPYAGGQLPCGAALSVPRAWGGGAHPRAPLPRPELERGRPAGAAAGVINATKGRREGKVCVLSDVVWKDEGLPELIGSIMRERF
eukprot:1158919-Pelagomonas_calceolata.AAC.7